MTEYKKLRFAYGFDEVALVPGDVTVNPEQTAVSFSIGDLNFPLPILASAMDAVVDIPFAIAMGELGGLAVLNLEGLQTRYQDPDAILAEIAAAPDDKVTSLLQRVYSEPIKENLVGERVSAVKGGGIVCAASVTPADTKRLAPLAVEAGLDVLVVQSTVTTARHISRSYRGLVLSELCRVMAIPVLVGNCVTYSAARELMENGIAGILVGVGPGAACTTREVLGIGVPQVTATMDCAAARDAYLEQGGRYVPVITDGGIRSSGDLCKAFASGTDAVMLGSILAQAEGSPGGGYHWGMSTPHPALPRGIRVKVGTSGSLEQILLGPTSDTHGTQNLIGALRTAMSLCGVRTIREMHQVEMVLAPSIKTEGKQLQLLQSYNR